MRPNASLRVPANRSHTERGENKDGFEQFIRTSVDALLSGQQRIEQLISSLVDHSTAPPTDTNLGVSSLSRQPSPSAPDSLADVDEDTQRTPRLQANTRCSQRTRDTWWHTSRSVSSEILDSLSMVQGDSRSSWKWPATLAIGWPRSLKMRHSLINDNVEEDEHLINAISSKLGPAVSDKGSYGSVMSIPSSWSLTSVARDRYARCSAWAAVITPTGPTRLVLDILSILCLSYDLITIPCFLAWDVEATGYVKDVQIAVSVFWTIDIIASFRTGYFHHNEVVTDSKKVAMHYLKRSFALEFAIVCVDWVSFVISVTSIGEMDKSTGSTAKFLRLGKLGRLLRLAGVIRMAKFVDVFHRMAGRNVSNGMLLCLELFKLLFTVVYINHVLGCVWFAIACHFYSDTRARWLHIPIEGVGTYEDTTTLFQYTTAFHWALSQMTPGSMQINAQNSIERIYNVFCLMFGVLFFGSLISALSAKMMEARMSNKQRSSQMAMVLKFLRERHVDSSMAFLIKNQVQERMTMKRPLLQHDVEALHFLSGKLQAELHLTMCKPILLKNALFTVMFKLGEHHISQICFRAMKFEARYNQEILFSPGDDSDQAYIICQGTMEYTQTPETALVSKKVQSHLEKGSWLAEAALWSEWMHVGTADCVEVVEILRINAQELMDSAKKNLVVKKLLLDFTKAYHSRLVSPLRGSKYPSDLSDDTNRCEDILSLLSKELQLLVSFVSMDVLSEAWSWAFSSSRLWSLDEEIRQGTSTLVPNSEGGVHRCVHLSCLRLLRKDETVFVLIGKWDVVERKVQPAFKLPGRKLKGWEDPEVALTRFLEEELPSLQQMIDVKKQEEEYELQKSSKYGIVTKYTKYIYEATLNSVFDDQLVPKPTRETAFYIVENAGNALVNVYAWLSQTRYEVLASTTEAGKADREQLLQGFDIGQAIELCFEDIMTNATDQVVGTESLELDLVDV